MCIASLPTPPQLKYIQIFGSENCVVTQNFGGGGRGGTWCSCDGHSHKLYVLIMQDCEGVAFEPAHSFPHVEKGLNCTWKNWW